MMQQLMSKLGQGYLLEVKLDGGEQQEENGEGAASRLLRPTSETSSHMPLKWRSLSSGSSTGYHKGLLTVCHKRLLHLRTVGSLSYFELLDSCLMEATSQS